MSRKSHRKSHSLVSTHDSSRQNIEPLTNQENSQTAQKIIERLSYLYSTHREIFDSSKKALLEKMVTKQFAKLCDMIELISIHRELLNQCQVILSSSIFLHFSIDTMSTIWMSTHIYKSQCKAILKSYRTNNLKVNAVFNRMQTLRIKKEILTDDVQFYRNLWDIHKLEDEKMIQFENEIWQILTSIPSEVTIPSVLSDVDASLFEESVNTTESKIRVYLIEGRVDESIGSAILMIAKRCLYLDAPRVGSKIISIATEILLKHADKESIKYNMLSLAEAFVLAYEKKFIEATKLVKYAISNVDNISSSLNVEKYYLKFQLGYFLCKWDCMTEGLNLLEETLSFFKANMPDTEVVWRKNGIILAQLYNDLHKNDMAYNHIEDIIKMYHIKLFGPLSAKNRPIYEFANDFLSKSSASSRLLQTVSTHLEYLPPYLMDSIRELIIVLASKNNFNGVKLIEKYMFDCMESHKVIAVCADDEIEDQGLLFNMVSKFKNVKSNTKIKK